MACLFWDVYPESNSNVQETFPERARRLPARWLLPGFFMPLSP
jgi:hypothetical protein